MPALSLLVSVCVVHGITLQSVLSVDSEDKAAETDVKIYLRYALIVGFYLATSAVQVAFHSGIMFRFFSHPVHDFIDALPLANISVFFFPEPLAGHYIHGRAASSSADLDLRGLSAQLRQEREMEVSARGLLSDSDDETIAENQLFEVYINDKSRRQYEQTLLDQLDANTFADRGQSAQASTAAAPEEHMLQAKQYVTSLMKDLVTTAEFNSAKQVRQKSVLERLMRLAPRVPQIVRSS